MVSALQQRNIESSHVHLVTEIVKTSVSAFFGKKFRESTVIFRSMLVIHTGQGKDYNFITFYTCP